KLELDLGNVSEENFPDALLNELDRLIRSEIVNQRKTQTNTGLSINGTPQNPNSVPGETVTGESAGNLEEKALLYFISSGVLPWYFQNQNPDLDKLFAKLFHTDTSHFFDTFLELLKNNNTAI